jgi:hypothetical protein
VIVQLYGGVPPVADRVWEYGVLVVVLGKLGVVITSAGIGEDVTVAVADLVLAALPVTVIVVVVVPEATQGAANRPLVEMEPLPVFFQVTLVSVVFLTMAVN